jgi:light-regulated signal transduction histidine kinase (bacteriophytochrome)
MPKQTADEPPAGPSPIEELRRLNAEYAWRIRRHAIELSAAQAEMDILAHTISHDLRSPLTLISGFTELLTKHSAKDLDEKGRHYLERITTSTAQIGRMIDEILALSRMSRSEMHFVQIDLETLVNRVVHELDASKGDRRVVWLIGRLPAVKADPTLMRQAFTSLASNALKFTQSREVARIQIGVMDGDHELKFFVRDNGAGLDLKHRERMFGAFQRPLSSTEMDGSGIGLAYVQRIIQRHGGRSWTEAVPDGGATFFFSLPDAGTEPEFRSERA